MDKISAYIQAIRDVYPDLAIKTTQFNKDGQFNDVLIINEESIFRFPKTEREATKLVTEVALLRGLQNHVTLPIPNPIYRSAETASVGQNFMGYSLLAGEPFWHKTFYAINDEGLLQHLANQLATFLHQMHSTQAGELVVNLPDFQGCAEWIDLYNRFRNKLFPIMRPDACAWVVQHFESFLNDERNCSYIPVLIHGDFGPSNILYDAETKSISGIIDFSSAGWGDPAIDFAAIICATSYGEEFLQRFAAVYPGIDVVLSRARFYAGTFALQEALYGIEDDDPASFENGIAAYR
ncbi:MAG: phosphotransferase family protein [Ktedonobacteraceae bacterium]